MKALLQTRSIYFFLGVILILGYAAGLVVYSLQLPSDGLGGHLGGEGFYINSLPLWEHPFRHGDVITGIAGRNLEERARVPGVWWRYLFDRQTEEVRYQVLRDGTTIEVMVSWRHLVPAQVLSRALPLFFVSFAFLAALSLIISSRVTVPGTLWIALAFAFQGLNGINNTLTGLGANLTMGLAWLFAPLDILSFGLSMSAFFHGLLLFPERKQLLDRYPFLPYLVHALNLLVALAAIFAVGSATPLQSRAIIFGRILYPLTAVELLLALSSLVHTYFTTQQAGVRNQIRWLVWGGVMGPLPWLLLYNLPTILRGAPLVPFWLAFLPVALVPVAFFFSATRRGLLAVDVLINRSLVYMALTVLLIGVYLLLAEGLDQLLTGVLGVTDPRVSAIVSIVLVALVAPSLYRHVQLLVNRLFYKHWLSARSLVTEISERIPTILQRDALLPILLEDIPQKLHARDATLLLPQGDGFVAEGVAVAKGGILATLDGSWVLPRGHPLFDYLAQISGVDVVSQHRGLEPALEPLRERDWEVILPLRSRGRLLGLYLLGARKSGDLFSQEELDMLTMLARQVAVTLENAQLYHEVERYTHQLEELVLDRTQGLREANRALSGERDRLNIILQNITDALLVLDPQGRVSLVNPAFEQIVKRAYVDIVGQPLDSVLNNVPVVGLIRQAMGDPGTVFSEDCAVGKLVLRVSSVTLKDGSGTITVLRDITRDVEVDRMKTEFISTVSHELRTPLTSVLGFTRLISKSLCRDVEPALPEGETRAQQAMSRIMDNLAIISTEGERLTRLINDVLDIAKMESGNMVWQDRLVNPAPIIQQAIEAVRAQAAENQVALRLNWDWDLPPLLIDPDRLHQVMLNLLSNAVKFTWQGTVTIQASQLESQEMHERWDFPPDNVGGVLITVSDTGVGIPPEELPQLFQRFKQIRTDTLVDKPRGTGLGLAICREIILHYQGVIWAESQEGEGSTFKFVLPLPSALPEEVKLPVAAQPVVKEIRRRVQGAVARQPQASPTVLIVDDEEHIRLMLSQEFAEAGYQVLEAVNGSDALKMARRHRPTAILLDVMMPDISGFDVTQILKADPATCDIPILILSIIEDREHGLALGADAYLTKPVESPVVLETLSSLIQETPRQPKAMVAGNDATALEQITRLLREQGFMVVEAYDIREVIDTAQEVQPDLVILDEMLSTLNDSEVIKALRFQEQSCNRTIVVVAGSESEQKQVTESVV